MLDKAGVVPLRAEDRLRDDIVSGRLQPNERLVESDLARSLGLPPGGATPGASPSSTALR